MLTLNGLNVVEAVLSFPRTGVWHADLKVDSADEITGAVVINVDEGRRLLHGTVQRGGNWQDVDHLRVVGGAGGMGVLCKPRHYTSTSMRIVLNDLLRGGGEALSATAETAVLGRTLPAWTTAALPVGRLVTQLLRSSGDGANWRMLPDGTLWVGHESWPDSGLTLDDFQVLTEDPARAEAIIGLEVPLLLPGTRLGDRRVSFVEHRIVDPETRTSVWFESGGADDRLRAALRGVVKAAQAPIDYLSHYFGTVVAQAGDFVDVKPTDLRLPSMGHVPLFGGLPGWELHVFPGGRVLIGWSGGDPSQPYALGFDTDVAAQSLALLANAVVIGDKAAAQPALLSTPYRAAEDLMLDALATGVQAALSSLGLVPAASALTAAQAAFHAAAPTFLSRQVSHS